MKTCSISIFQIRCNKEKKEGDTISKIKVKQIIFSGYIYITISLSLYIYLSLSLTGNNWIDRFS